MAWRLAGSLEVLRSEIKTKAPRTTVYTIGDPDHQARSSDHNPNAAGVVCAIDVMPGGGLDLAEFAEDVRRRRHPAGKYVIYQDRIASAGRDWVWRDHAGEYHEHVHVSVGVGPDGDSTGPYDNTEPWLGDDMTPEQDRLLRNVERILTTGWSERDAYDIQYKEGSAKLVLANPFVKLGKQLAELAARPQADVDEAALAAALAPLLEQGASADEIAAAVTATLAAKLGG
jgi:hypothetical protein